MGLFEDYKERGGLPGIALAILKEELTEAHSDEEHVLRSVVDSLCQDREAEAANRMVDILQAIPEGHRLSLPKMVFYTLPAVQATLNELADEILAGKDPCPEMPEAIRRWADMEAGSRADRSALARKAAKPGKLRSPKEGGVRDQKETVIAAMRRARQEGHTLEDFLESVRSGADTDLSVIVQGEGYEFHHAYYGTPYKVVKRSALDKWWSKAGKFIAGK